LRSILEAISLKLRQILFLILDLSSQPGILYYAVNTVLVQEQIEEQVKQKLLL